MSESAITIDRVSKRYRLGAHHGETGRLTQRLDTALRAPMRRLRHKVRVQGEIEEEFWALRDVSLQIQPGEVFGLVGANGAGKSTLLKLMSRITPPTRGRITLRGRVGSLLEVGTGFNPELTGRENVFLNGAILGMRRREILARFEEIVEFSGISRFLDTPVKRYSSGMYVRLAFAVAAHLEPEILLVDEVLSVGDAEFQRRCIGKMEDVAQRHGRTIVFVSHNLGSIRRLCDRAAFLERGRIAREGRVDDVIAAYLENLGPAQHGGTAGILPDTPRVGTGAARMVQISLLGRDDEPLARVRFGEPFTVSMIFEVSEPLPSAVAVVGISTADGTRILTTSSTDRGSSEFRLERGSVEIRVELSTTLLPGEFVVDAGLMDTNGGAIDYLERALSLTAINVPHEGSDDHYQWATVRGFVRPDSEWAIVGHGETMVERVRSVQ